jgi:hypothetical protein
MQVIKARAPRRRIDLWFWWRRHLEAQRASGLSQQTFCPEQGLDPQYFSVWKRKLVQSDRGKLEQTGRSLLDLRVRCNSCRWASKAPLPTQQTLFEVFCST